jgi:hypothetical protein
LNIPVKLTNIVSFFKDMKLKYNDGQGTRDIVKFLGDDFGENMQIKCQVKSSNDAVIIVDPKKLNFIENPDIASILQTSKEYCCECKNIEPSQLKHILSPQSLSPLQEEMMSHHYRLHHTPFPKLVTIAEQGEIPKRLAALKGCCLICVVCLFGQAHKCSWQSKSKQKHPICKPTDDAPEKKASLDQMVSAQPGLIPQMSGHLTNLRVMAATVFVDHLLDHVYVYLMKDLTLSETPLAKHAYEHFPASLGVESKSYHAYNGLFADKSFRDNYISSNQTITFCGIGSHHQNEIAERKIKDITLDGQTLLLHAKCMFPEYISTILWPFAVKCYKDRLNNLVHHADGCTPYETLASLDAAPINMSNFHSFGCPCYVLDHRLQSGTGKIPKWEPRAQMCIYVGRSPSHASNVALILNSRTGHVLLQFHVVYDDDFTTVPYLRTAAVPPHWAKLVCASLTISLYTERKIGTWQSIPELNVELGDFTLDIPNIDTASSTTSTQHHEGDDGHSEGAINMVSHHKNNVTKQVTFSDQGQDNKIQSNSPDLSTTQSDE